MTMIDFDSLLEYKIRLSAHHPELNLILNYATRPPGKLFRPRLLEHLCQDLKIRDTEDIQHLGCALEFHHAYSLVHDDLPCMDNDPERRGKPSTHIKFNEWKALLAGDALMSLSYAELLRIKSKQKDLISKIFLWATGARGLILGQWIDLGHEARDIKAILRMHELKTARLMQIATLSALALHHPPKLKEIKSSLKLGSAIGLSFQLLDDLDDLNSASEHELAINPFILDPQEALNYLIENLEYLKQIPYLSTKNFLINFIHSSVNNILAKKDWEEQFDDSQIKTIRAHLSSYQ
jgi:geranylgeranyl pyrophosphate synthase